MKLQKLSKNNHAAIEILYYIITIFVVGALYSILFIGIAFPAFKNFIPASDSKTLIMMFMYGLPGIILIVGVIALIKYGIDKNKQGGW